ncbi:anti-sigma factor [Kribbella sp. CA-294648]|uniref:anti-sigma factor n=1 Tax=Kribbella sp. CA-294648 TaxID=3239948 RepID=UPI003D90ECF8
MDDEIGFGNADGSAPGGPPELGDLLTTVLRSDELWQDPPAWLEDNLFAEISPTSTDHSGTVVPLHRRMTAKAHRGRRFQLIAAAAGLVATAGAVSAMMARADGLEVAMAGTSLASEASAKARVKETPSGVEFQLDVKGLPPAPNGSYYQGWVRGDEGQVTIGTFHLRGGSDDVVLWSGVSSQSYRKLTVTLQNAAGGAASSGQVVLVGEIPGSK